MNLVDQLNRIERELPADWAEAQCLLVVEDEAESERAAALLGPANPWRRGRQIRFSFVRRGPGLAPDAARRLLRRLVQEGISCELKLVGTQEAAEELKPKRPSLLAEWEEALAAVPPDWSDLYAEVRLDSTDYLERAALLLAPLNPQHFGAPSSLRFRGAHHFGYGASAEMVARCLQRCDEEEITGAVQILRVLSDTYPVQTQGPVWYVGGRPV